MRKLTLVLALSLFTLFGFAQKSEGIQFNHGTWADITAKAKKAKQLIFIDCYTSWCGPCKQLSKQIFPLKNVGDVFNANFINYKVDMEKGEGVDLKNKFHVGAFPTLLWVDYKGSVVHRIVGFRQADQLLTEAQKAVDGGSDAADLEKKYKKNKNDIKVVEAYLNSLISTYDSRTKDVAAHYLSIIPEEQYLNKDIYDLIARQIKSPFSPVISYILKNRYAFDEKFTKEHVDMVLSGKYYIYANTLVYAVKEGKIFDEDAFQKLITLMDERNFDAKNQVIETTRIKVLQYKNDWKAYVTKINGLYENGFYKNADFQTYYQWYMPVVGSDCKDVAVLEAVLNWINMAFKDNDAFSMFYFKMYWEAKVKVLERMDAKNDELAKAKIELAFINELNVKQKAYNEKQAEEEKRTGKKSRGIPAIRMH